MVRPSQNLRLALALLIACAVLPLETTSASPDDDDLAPTETATSARTKPQPAPYKPMNLYSLLTAADLAAELQERHARASTFPELVEMVTRGLVAAPYLLSPLGEGEAPDVDPRFRLDAFDCTTFVETAIALATCDDLRDAEALLDRIRYSGAPGFQARRHLMTSQWVPGLIEAGYLEDITREVGGDATQVVTLELTPERWARRRIAKTLVLDDVPVGTFTLPYLTIDEVEARQKDIPPGTIVNVVRADVRSSPDVVTHQALVILHPGDDTRWVRHASPVSKRVIDETLEHMLMRYRRPRKWKIVGFNLVKIVDPRE